MRSIILIWITLHDTQKDPLKFTGMVGDRFANLPKAHHSSKLLQRTGYRRK
jgi:hypothetical protein